MHCVLLLFRAVNPWRAGIPSGNCSAQGCERGFHKHSFSKQENVKWGENHLLLTPKVEHAMLWELTGAVGVISLFHRGCGQKRRPG